MADDDARCVCGHVKEAHEHYRRGSDCGICGSAICGAYRAAQSHPVTDGPLGGTPTRDEHRPAS
jgi:ethanolamine ammonia-lyase large subunit